MGLKNVLLPDKNSDDYKARKELKRIAKENVKIINKYEKEKKRRNISESEYTTKMKDKNNIIEFDQLETHFFTDAGIVKAVNKVSFEIPFGKTVGIVGESGCGKSVTSLSLMRLVQAPTGQIVGGAIRYNRGGFDVDITKIPIEEMQKIRGNEISMIFQEPMTSLNPVFTIGDQIDEVILLHSPNINKKEVKEKTIDILKLVSIARPEGIYKAYPHELSGGMRQRVMIAMALACNPKLIIADEPTTALDVTIQAQILDLLRDIKHKINASIMLITHDLGVIAEMADYVIVMYAGKIVECGTADDIFYNTSHPYTVGLLQSKPVVNKIVDRLYSIPGQVPNPVNMPSHCYFKSRCEKCVEKCENVFPELVSISSTHKVACCLYTGGAL